MYATRTYIIGTPRIVRLSVERFPVGEHVCVVLCVSVCGNQSSRARVPDSHSPVGAVPVLCCVCMCVACVHAGIPPLCHALLALHL